MFVLEIKRSTFVSCISVMMFVMIAMMSLMMLSFCDVVMFSSTHYQLIQYITIQLKPSYNYLYFTMFTTQSNKLPVIKLNAGESQILNLGLKMIIYYNQMLIKTQVKRRTQIINNYILSVKQKVYNRKYRQAIQMLKYSRESINNSYIAPYNPNAFLLDSLKAKNQKLRQQKKIVQMRIMQRLEDINKVKQKRGYTKQGETYNSTQTQYIQKFCAEQIGAYASRLNLKLTDVQKIDYDPVTLQTDFHSLRVLIDDTSTTIPFRSIISVDSQQIYMLICWRTDKNINHSYMIIKFDHEEQRIMWSRCIMFSKLICESQFKGKLFFKEQNYQVNIKLQKSQKKQMNQKSANDFSDKNSSIKAFNLNIGTNKTPAYDRLRRKSQYTPHGASFNIGLGLKYRSKSRKTSQDLSLKEAYNKTALFQRRLIKEKSRKSFQQDRNSLAGKIIQQNKKQLPKETIKKNDPNSPTSKIQKLIQQREKLQLEHKNNSSNTQSNRQIFFNESSIHWIQQQNDQQKSKTSSKNSNSNKNISQNKIVSLDIFQKEQHVEQSEHISQVPAETQQSPLLPYNLRQAKKNEKEFKVDIKEVPNGIGKKNQKLPSIQNKRRQSVDKKSNSSKNHSAGLKKQKMEDIENNSMEQQQFEDQDNDDEIQVNEYSEGYEDSPDKIKGHTSKNLEIEDKSQDLMSQNQESQTQSRKYGLDDLKFGLMVLKCSSSGWKPHLKKLFLSNNDSQICWKNQKGDDLKKINISDIQKIQYGVITLGITKHIKNIQKRRCMSIKYKNNNQYKLLEFYLPQKQPIEHIQQFYQKLNVYVRYKNTHEL